MLAASSHGCSRRGSTSRSSTSSRRPGTARPLSPRRPENGMTPPVVDVHGHTWPVLADAPENALFLQRHTIWHTQPPRRLADGRPAEAQTLFDGRGGGRSNLLDVGFRFGEHGRVEWTHEGVDYYLQWMPELMATMVMPPELTIALMNNV